MDFNQLYFHHQILRINADRRKPEATAEQHEREAALVAGRIACMQRAIGATAAEGWNRLALSDPDATGMPLAQQYGPNRGPTRWQSTIPKVRS